MTVSRWHSHPDDRLRKSGDTVEAHGNRVERLCASLTAAMGHALSGALLRAARHHDGAEQVLGDLPYPAKQRFPALAAAYAEAEAIVLAEMGLVWTLTSDEAAILHLCDRLDAYMWARRCGVTGPEWDAMLLGIKGKAEALGPLAGAWLENQLTCAR